MSVQFTKMLFHNTASVDVTLTVEAPVGHKVAGPQKVPLNSTATINPAVSDCASVLLRVISDADPNEETQTLAVTPPLSLQTVDVNYFIGSFLPASVTASTGGIAAPQKASGKKQY
jgi:hypothetical protein